MSAGVRSVADVTLPQPDRGPDPSCSVCAQHGIEVPDAPARLGPVLLVAGLLRATASVATTALSARFAADPIDLQPRVLRTA